MSDLKNWRGLGVEVLQNWLRREAGTNSDAGSFGLDIFINGIEDEFPSDPDDGVEGAYPTYSPEANRASEGKPWGDDFGNRPKLHELNQPQPAQALGWRIIDFYPDRDRKWDFHRLAGTPSEIRILSQILILLRKQNGYISFEKWFKLWERGFPNFTEERSHNFLLSSSIKDDPRVWERVRFPDLRPRYKDWMTGVQKANFGFRTIEYFPRGFDNESFFLSGSDSDLIRHIIAIEYRGGSEAGDVRMAKPGKLVAGHPLVVLKFKENLPQGSKQRPIFFEKSFRLMDKTDAPSDPNFDKISKADLEKIADRILLAFPKEYKWKYGHKCVSVKGPISRRQGIDGWAYCLNKGDGIELFQKIAQCAGVTLNQKEICYSEAVDESKFAGTNTEYELLGRKVNIPTPRKKCDAVFYSAEIHLPFSNQKIQLVKGSLKLV